MTVSIDLYEKFKARHGFDLADLEEIYELLSRCDRDLFSLSVKWAEQNNSTPAGKNGSKHFAAQMENLAESLEEGAFCLQVIMYQLLEEERFESF
jgi:hypothetical protein